MTTDPFGTAELRSAVLNAWERSPVRFREDANTEEDHATGYYRDRVIVELAQNAADAAARAGQPGCLALWLVEDKAGVRLVAANTGTGLDASGVASLSSLRASAKTAAPGAAPAPGAGAGAVGRFGVGFAAVRSVSDDITVASRDGGVRFSLDLTRSALADVPALTEQIGARGGVLPILRLPFPVGAHPGGGIASDQVASDHVASGLLVTSDLAGFDTVVALVLRDAAAVAAVRQQLAAVDDILLLALPALDVIEVTDGDHRVLSDAHTRWISVTRTGVVPGGLLGTRPVEERERTGWSVTWAYPRDPARRVTDAVVHAPTPTDEPLSLPALLLATFPLDPSRRHVAEGELTQFLVGAAAGAYAELAAQVPDALELVPTWLPRGRLDADLCEAVVAELHGAPVLSGRVPADVTVIDGEVSHALVEALAPTGLGIVAVERRQLGAARRLGAQVCSLADVIDALPDGLTPRQWREVYGALAPYADQDRSVREALDAILVPCTDGSTVRGPHGLLLSQGPNPPALDGLRVVHPDAAHPLLHRLGALPDDEPAVLALPAVEQAVRRAGDDLLDRDVDDTVEIDAGPAADPAADLLAVIAMVDRVVAVRDLAPADLPAWFSLLPLPGDDGVWQRAEEVSWPGTWAALHLDLNTVEVESLTSLTEATARVLGVRFDLVARLVEPDDEDAGLPGWADYADYLHAVLGPDEPADAVWTIADLDVVHDDSWPAVLERLSHDPDLRRAVVTGLRSTAPGTGEAVSYAAWYLRDTFGAPWVAGSPLVRGEQGMEGWEASARTQAEDLEGVLAARPAELAALTELGDPELARALGGVGAYRDLDRFLAGTNPTAWDGFFAGLSTQRATVTAVAMPLARVVWTALERACAGGLELEELPEVIIALQGATARIVAADDVVVTDQPMWAQVRAVVPVSAGHLVEAVADALDCDVPDASSVIVHGDLDSSESSVRDVPAWIAAIVPGVPRRWTAHTELSVEGRDVDWWVTAGGEVHARADAPASAVAAACAQVARRWSERYLIEIALREGERRADLAAASAWDGLTL